VASVPPTQSSTVETLTRASPRTIGSLLCRSCFLRLLSAPPVSWLRAALFRRVTFRPSSQHSINNNVLIQIPPRSYRTLAMCLTHLTYRYYSSCRYLPVSSPS
jgi:hypothetical protein